MYKKLFLTGLVFVSGLVFLEPFQTAVAETRNKTPVISIIIDDIGYRNQLDREALAIPGPIAYAIMPHSPLAVTMAKIANEKNKDVLLHLPMEAVKDDKNRFLGPGALMLDMRRKDFINTLKGDYQSIPNIIGVNNHMGSLLTRHAGRMEWLMDFLQSRNIFYVDSMTSRLSVASQIASEKNVPHLRRDVFLDNLQTTEHVMSQFDELIKTAKRKGTAIAIGHPHNVTISVLTERLNQLDKYGVNLISLKKMVNDKNPQSLNTVSLYPDHSSALRTGQNR